MLLTSLAVENHLAGAMADLTFPSILGEPSSVWGRGGSWALGASSAGKTPLSQPVVLQHWGSPLLLPWNKPWP